MSEQATALLKECQDQIELSKKMLQNILAPQEERTVDNTLKPYDDMMIVLGNAAAKASLFNSVHPEKDVREVEETCEQDVKKVLTDLSLKRELFDAIGNVSPTSLSQADTKTKRFIELELRDFRRSGVDKDEATREKIRKINEELVAIGLDFDRNIKDDVRSIELDSEADLAGLPEDYIKAHLPKEPGKKITITTDYPDMTPFLTYAKSSEARRRLMIASQTRGYPKNIEVLKNLLQKRYELATLLGYPNWANYITEDKMIRNDQAVKNFVENLTAEAGDRAKSEIETLLEEKRKDEPNATFIGEWEKFYYSERVKSAKYQVDSKEVRQYLPAQRVREGILNLTQTIFGLKYEKAVDAELWHPSVEAYNVINTSTNQKVGRIYLDLYPREGKYKHAAQFEVKSGILGKQLPEGAIVCNFPEPKGDDPGLMEHDDVTTIFHEFGHLLHHILGGNQEWKRFSGVATEWDFVEVPSQLLEEWAWDAKVLQSFARHYKTNEPIPVELVQKMRRAERFGTGVNVRQQMYYASISLNFHNQDPSTFDTTEYMKQLKAKISMYPYLEGTYFHTSFGHLNGYSAIYYTYMWSLVIAKDFLGSFRDSSGNLNLLNAEIAKKYRDKILVPGGSRDAADLVRDFLGRDFKFDEFKKWLSET